MQKNSSSHAGGDMSDLKENQDHFRPLLFIFHLVYTVPYPLEKRCYLEPKSVLWAVPIGEPFEKPLLIPGRTNTSVSK